MLADFPWYHHLFTLSGVQGADKRGSGRGKGKSGRRCRPGAVIRLLLKCRRVLPDVTAVACSNVGIINHPHFCRPGTLTDPVRFDNVELMWFFGVALAMCLAVSSEGCPEGQNLLYLMLAYWLVAMLVRVRSKT